MIELDSNAVTILMGGCLGLLILVLLLIFRISSRIRWIENQLLQNLGINRQGGDADAPSGAESSRGGAFEAFLEEDPGRRELAKAEQFSAFRKWRQEKGMNWSNS